MSLYPVYKRMVRGSTVDPNDYDFYNRRTLRSLSALPESLYLRGHDSLPTSLVQRALSTARDIIEEPTPTLRSLDFVDYYDTNNTLGRLKESLRRSDDYWLDRYTQAVLRPKTNVYISSSGREYPIYTSTRKFPSSYWSYYPYSRTLPPYYNYGRRYWSLNDPLDNYLHSGDSYTSSKGISRLTWRNWALDYPYRSYTHYYRPSYIHSPRIRNSYLYPRYI